MKLRSLTLRNFRNIEEASFEADPHLNFLIGANGQGKTSFLEALGFVATLRSFRGSKTDEVIQWDRPQAEVLCRTEDEDWSTDLRMTFEAPVPGLLTNASKKTAYINGKAFRSSTQYLSQRFGNVSLGFHAVVFNPSDHDLVRGDPAGRRTYLDRVLAAENVEYLKTLQKYQRALTQKNALLKQDGPLDLQLLTGFNDQLARYGAWIADRRLEWIERLSRDLNNTLRQIAPRGPFLRLIYLSNWTPEMGDLAFSNNNLDSIHFSGQLRRPSLEILEQSFWSRLSALEDAERRTQSSLVGPHRDDWTFFLGDHVLKGHGSQGEVRSALLALKLCEIELFRRQTRHRPLLLLDDFSSELDQQRRTFLLRYLSETDLQVFVTSTEDSIGTGRRFMISNGRVEQQSGSSRVLSG